MKHHFLAHILHILKSIELIQAYASPNIFDSLHDSKTHDAIVRRLQTLAESAYKLPDDIKSVHPEIAWHSIYGLRNVLVHDYLGDLNHAAIEGVIKNRLPELYKAMLDHAPNWQELKMRKSK